MNMKNKLILVSLTLIVLFGAGLRLYRIDQIPHALSWDEAATGYNAWTIGNYGRDEWGKFMPPYFTSFRDDKHPVHIYSTVIPVKIFGLNELGTRLPSALFGIANIILIFFLGRLIFKRSLIGLIAAFVLTISPYHIQFSRFNHELNFAVFFGLLGLFLCLKGFRDKPNLIPLGVLSFMLAFISYHSAKIISPVMLVVIFGLNFNKLLVLKRQMVYSTLVIVIFGVLLLTNPALLGSARVSQTAFKSEDLMKTRIYQSTKNETLAKLELAKDKYLMHFTNEYLFETGDRNPKFSTQYMGQFYKLDGLFLVIGLLGVVLAFIVKKENRKNLLILVVLALLAPIPASFSNEAPHASRAMFMVGSWHLLIAFGIFIVVNLVKNIKLQLMILVVIFLIYLIPFKNYLNFYYSDYSKSAIEWQYGMKQIVEYVRLHPEYTSVYTTDIRSQPYIFFLYYLNFPLPEYLKTAQLNDKKETNSFNLISQFDRYHFGDWDPIQSMPHGGVLYVVSPSQYDGLAHKVDFDVKKVIKYPNGNDAFFLVTAK